MMFNFYLAITFSLIILTCLGHYLEHLKNPLLHESSVGILVGFVIGAIGRLLFSSTDLNRLNEDLFFNILLPPIIFSAAYSLKKKNFFNNFGAVMVYGMLCTFMSFGIVFFIIYESSNLGWLLDLSSGTPFQLSKGEAALVAAIFSATDSVSALSIINPKKFPTLYSILAGEGIINDGMAIVIFKIVEYVNESGAETNAAGFIILEFLQLTLGSAAVGILLGLSHAILVKYQSHEPHPIRNVCLLCFFAYISYELAQTLGLSGIISIFFCGISMTHYSWYSFSTEMRYASLLVANGLAFFAEAFTFICLGAFIWESTNSSNWSPTFSVVIFAAIIISRILSVIFLSFFLNMFRKQKITPKMQIIISWSGLIRGALVFILCLDIHTDNQSYIFTSTLSVAIFTSIFLASLSEKVIHFVNSNETSTETIPLNQPKPQPRGFKKFDNSYLKPFFRKNWKPNQKEGIRESAHFLKKSEGKDQKASQGKFSSESKKTPLISSKDRVLSDANPDVESQSNDIPDSKNRKARYSMATKNGSLYPFRDILRESLQIKDLNENPIPDEIPDSSNEAIDKELKSIGNDSNKSSAV